MSTEHTSGKIFVGGLSYNTHNESLHAFFAHFGELREAVVLREAGGRSRGFGFVVFTTKRGADAALASAAQAPLVVDGRRVDVKRAVPRDGPESPISPSMIGSSSRPAGVGAGIPVKLAVKLPNAPMPAAAPVPAKVPLSAVTAKPGTAVALGMVSQVSSSAPVAAHVLTVSSEGAGTGGKPMSKVAVPAPVPTPAAVQPVTAPSYKEDVPAKTGKSVSEASSVDGKPKVTVALPLGKVAAPSKSPASAAGTPLASKTAPGAAAMPVIVAPPAPTAIPANAGALGSPASVAARKVFVGGLHYGTDETALRTYFTKFGPIASAQVLYNRETRKSRGFGFIVYADRGAAPTPEGVTGGPDAVERVLALGVFHRLDGKDVEIKRAVPKVGDGAGVIGSLPAVVPATARPGAKPASKSGMAVMIAAAPPVPSAWAGVNAGSLAGRLRLQTQASPGADDKGKAHDTGDIGGNALYPHASDGDIHNDGEMNAEEWIESEDDEEEAILAAFGHGGMLSAEGAGEGEEGEEVYSALEEGIRAATAGGSEGQEGEEGEEMEGMEEKGQGKSQSSPNVGPQRAFLSRIAGDAGPTHGGPVRASHRLRTVSGTSETWGSVGSTSVAGETGAGVGPHTGKSGRSQSSGSNGLAGAGATRSRGATVESVGSLAVGGGAAGSPDQSPLASASDNGSTGSVSAAQLAQAVRLGMQLGKQLGGSGAVETQAAQAALLAAALQQAQAQVQAQAQAQAQVQAQVNGANLQALLQALQGQGGLHLLQLLQAQGMGQPGMGQSGMGQSGMGQSGMGQPGMGQSGMGQPGMGQSGMGQSGMGQPGMGQSGMGQPGMGQPGMGQLGMGQPGMGQSGMGQSGMGQSGMVQPGMGQPGMGQLGMGQPMQQYRQSQQQQQQQQQHQQFMQQQQHAVPSHASLMAGLLGQQLPAVGSGSSPGTAFDSNSYVTSGGLLGLGLGPPGLGGVPQSASGTNQSQHAWSGHMQDRASKYDGGDTSSLLSGRTDGSNQGQSQGTLGVHPGHSTLGPAGRRDYAGAVGGSRSLQGQMHGRADSAGSFLSVYGSSDQGSTSTVPGPTMYGHSQGGQDLGLGAMYGQGYGFGTGTAQSNMGMGNTSLGLGMGLGGLSLQQLGPLSSLGNALPFVPSGQGGQDATQSFGNSGRPGQGQGDPRQSQW